MYIVYYPDIDEYEVKGKIFKVFFNKKSYNDFLELYDFIEYKDDNIYNAYTIFSEKLSKQKKYYYCFYVEEAAHNDIIDNDEKLLNLYEELKK